MLEQINEGLLRPLDVVHHDEQRPFARDPLQQLSGGPGELIATSWGIARDHGLEMACNQLGVGLVLEEFDQTGAQLLDRAVQDLDQRPIRDALSVR